MTAWDHLINGVLISVIVFSLNSLQQIYASRREDVRRLVDLALVELDCLEKDLYFYLSRTSKLDDQRLIEESINRRVLRLVDISKVLILRKRKEVKSLKTPEIHCSRLFDIATGGSFQSVQIKADRRRSKDARDRISQLKRSLYVC